MTETRVRRTGWYVLVRWSAIGLILVHGAIAVARFDREAGLAAIGLIVGLVVLRWRRRPGVVLLGLQFANAGFWTVLATLSNISHGDGFVHTMIPAVIAVLSLVGLVSAIAELFIPPAPTARLRGPRFVAIGAIVILVAAVVGSFLGPERASAQSGDLRVTTENLEFEPKTIEVRAGRVAVFAENEDLFWHTFTIPELDVDLKLSEGARRRAEFEATAGRYAFKCTIPGHTQAGMKGTLVVR
jgi:plastocyanin